MKYVYNAIRTPDGTIIESRHRHDYVTYTDKNGSQYMVDGGLEYLRRGWGESRDYEDISVALEDGHEKVRQACKWGTYGKDGKQPYREVKLCDMEDDHIRACLETQRIHPHYADAFRTELEYRHEIKTDSYK